MPDELIRVKNLTFRFDDIAVLEDVSFSVHRGEALVVMGESGCGKTTLLKILTGLLKPLRGSVEILGENLAHMDEDALDEFRLRIGMLFQFGALINSLTVGENVLLALQRRMNLPEKTAERVARLKLSMVGLEDVFHRYPSELSGGMKKRAGLARAMIMDPEILLFDEPTSGLDPNTAAELDALVLELKRLLRTTMLVVTHDLQTAFTVADRIIMLHQGRVAASGNEESLRKSRNPVVKRFIERRGREARGTRDEDWQTLFFEGA